jgi:hypothetical protein
VLFRSPYEVPEEVVEEEETEVESTFSDEEIQSDEDGQITLF